MKRIIIIGGVAGGMSAATRLRRLMEDAEIIIYEKGPYVSFANCGLPYHLSGEILERSSLIVQSPKALKERFNLDVRPNHEVIEIHPENKTIKVSFQGEIFIDHYDELILSPGAQPLIPPIKGIDKAKNVYSLRNIPDLDQIMNHVKKESIKNAVVIGAGFIGLEMAENLKNNGFHVSIVEMSDHVLPPFDIEMAGFVEEKLLSKDVAVYTHTSVIEFKNEGNTIILSTGDEINSDLTILSTGVTPSTKFLEGSGIKLGLRNAIIVDQHYRTNFENIYAVGDATLTLNQLNNEFTLIPLASPANRQGRQVADVIAGLPTTNRGSIGTAILRVFDSQAASTGLNEKQLQQNHLPYQAVHITSKDHAAYFPGATMVAIKLLFHPKNGQLWGAQAFGPKGIDKRIDILSTAIKGKLTVFDLQELEFTYAPPFGSAKDPVNMLGYAAANLIQNISESIQWHELTEELNQGTILLDVRSEEEINQSRAFKRSINIPLNSLRQRMNELDPSQSYIVTCHSGQRSYIAERMLKQHGFNVRNLDGSYAIYSKTSAEELI